MYVSYKCTSLNIALKIIWAFIDKCQSKYAHTYMSKSISGKIKIVSYSVERNHQKVYHEIRKNGAKLSFPHIIKLQAKIVG